MSKRSSRVAEFAQTSFVTWLEHRFDAVVSISEFSILAVGKSLHNPSVVIDVSYQVAGEEEPRHEIIELTK